MRKIIEIECKTIETQKMMRRTRKNDSCTSIDTKNGSDITMVGVCTSHEYNKQVLKKPHRNF